MNQSVERLFSTSARLSHRLRSSSPLVREDAKRTDSGPELLSPGLVVRVLQLMLLILFVISKYLLLESICEGMASVVSSNEWFYNKCILLALAVYWTSVSDVNELLIATPLQS